MNRGQTWPVETVTPVRTIEHANSRTPQKMNVRIRVWPFITGLMLLGTGCGVLKSVPEASDQPGEVIERVTEKGPLKLVVRVSPPEPRLSDLLQMQIRVTAPKEIEVHPPSFGAAVGDFVIRDYSQKQFPAAPEQAKSSTEMTTHQFIYQLEPAQSGRHLIRSMAIEYIDHRPESENRDQTLLIESEPIQIVVTSEFGDQVPSLSDLEPMFAPRPLPGKSHWPWLLVASLILIAGSFGIWRWRRLKGPKTEVAVQSPEELAHAALALLLAENLPSKGLVKEFYLRLTGIVRQYIEGSTGLRAPEQTTEEFLSVMHTREVFPVAKSQRLKEFLEAADMVKYAGQQPTAEQVELSIARAREFIDLRRVPRVESIASPGDLSGNVTNTGEDH